MVGGRHDGHLGLRGHGRADLGHAGVGTLRGMVGVRRMTSGVTLRATGVGGMLMMMTGVTGDCRRGRERSSEFGRNNAGIARLWKRDGRKSGVERKVAFSFAVSVSRKTKW